MDLEEKILHALDTLGVEAVRLDVSDGDYSGVAISTLFRGRSGMERQDAIDACLAADGALTQAERLRVIMIAGLTPEEHREIGSRILVYGCEEVSDGVAITYFGAADDAQHLVTTIRTGGTLDVEATVPVPVLSEHGKSLRFVIRPVGGDAISAEAVTRRLLADPFIAFATPATT